MSDEPAISADGGLVRLRLDLGYDGTEFSGWAAQPGRRTVEGNLCGALTTVLRLDEPGELTVAGRTDAGVHARGQVAHLDVPSEIWREFADSLVRRLAGVLPSDVRVWSAAHSPAGFDARFSALSRSYAYRVATHPGGVDPLRRREVLWHPRPLDLDRMNTAAQLLLGEHDFAAYCRRREGASTVRRLVAFEWQRVGEIWAANLTADAFCHNMVRALVGAVISVGEGRRPVEWPADVLATRQRNPAVQVMPPHGLTLESVQYPSAGELAERASITRRHRPR